MSRAIPVPIRQAIVQRRLEGETLPFIAEQLALSFPTVRQIWRRYRDFGEAGLQPSYQNCGPHKPHAPPLVVRAALWLHRRHPGWGAGLIRVLLVQKWPSLKVPHERTLQRWFARAAPPKPPPPPAVNPCRAKQPHERWQVDAKEQVALADGTKVCWLSVTDEATGAELETKVFSPCPVGARRGRSGAGGDAGSVRHLGAAPIDPGG